MRFTGRNLELVAVALAWALDEVRTRIGSCPDVKEYADDIAELEAIGEELWLLGMRVEKRLEPAA